MSSLAVVNWAAKVVIFRQTSGIGTEVSPKCRFERETLFLK